MREERKLYRDLVGKTPVGRSRCRLEDGIKMDLREIAWEGVGWVHWDQDRDW
jgi:hypothetical protein